MTTLAHTYETGVKVVRQRAICTVDRLGVRSFYYGLGLLGLLFGEMVVDALLYPFPKLNQRYVCLSMWALTTVVGPLPALFYWRIHLSTFRRRLISSLLTALGLSCVPWITSMIFTIHILPDGGTLALVYQSIFGGIIGIPLLASVWTLLSMLAWPMIMRLAPFKIQDGATCPKCGYCVRGVSSRICPECGRAFNKADLGLSTAEFERLISGEAQAVHNSKLD